MGRCDVCGNDYENTFTVQKDGQTYSFDCFECAVHKLAPSCEHCGCRILGHGLEQAGSIFCCAACARAVGKTDLRDHSDAPMFPTL